jgi:hypothetical protein
MQPQHLIPQNLRCMHAIPITAGETLSLDQEKLVLANGDTLVAKSDTANALVMTISTLAV